MAELLKKLNELSGKILDTVRKQRWKIVIKGVVQGVGFRPFVFTKAAQFGLTGRTYNYGGELHIEVQGHHEQIIKFANDVYSKPPERASISGLDIAKIPLKISEENFLIDESKKDESASVYPSTDIAICGECAGELFDENNKRFMHPFISCTNCGPRFTITEEVPYDRQNTTMADFLMCPGCEREYSDPYDRRFHSQPNACRECGPKIHLYSYYHPELRKILSGKDHEFLSQAAGLIKNGGIALVKGLGGYHLACKASSDRAVLKIRNIKKRPYKPLAVMVLGLNEAHKIAFIDQNERRALNSSAAPVVLLRARKESKISNFIAPGNDRLGIMLASTPLHKILLHLVGEPLVMTSGNLSGTPIEYQTSKAFNVFSSKVDIIIDNNRPVFQPVDDSVVQVAGSKNVILRRARGFVPDSIDLAIGTRPTLACGADMKSAFGIAKDNKAYLSQYTGNLENLSNFERYRDIYGKFSRLFMFEPEIIAYDMHPQYLSAEFAKSLKAKKRVAVQHHHAHIASCMAEHKVSEPVIGVAFDGTGYGTDGNIWGGEFLVAGTNSFQRVAHLKYAPMPGGEACIDKPYRMAAATLIANGLGNKIHALGMDIGEFEVDAVTRQIEGKLNTPYTSSAGRLFDAVSAMLGICAKSTYEGQAAVELASAASEEYCQRYPFKISGDLPFEIDYRDMLAKILADIRKNVLASDISAKFHNTMARMISECCLRLRDVYRIDTVALSGGVFQNRRLLVHAESLLSQNGFNVIFNEKVPSNDGGIALGQIIVANSVSRCA